MNGGWGLREVQVGCGATLPGKSDLGIKSRPHGLSEIGSGGQVREVGGFNLQHPGNSNLWPCSIIQNLGFTSWFCGFYVRFHGFYFRGVFPGILPNKLNQNMNLLEYRERNINTWSSVQFNTFTNKWIHSHRRHKSNSKHNNLVTHLNWCVTE